MATRKRQICKRGRRKGTRSCKRKPGPKKGKKLSSRRRKRNMKSRRKYRVRSRQSAHSRLGTSVPTVQDIQRQQRQERFSQSASSLGPRLITVKNIVQNMGVAVSQKDLNKIGKAVAKYFEKKVGVKSGLKKRELVEVKPGKIKEFKVTAYHDSPRNRALIELVIRAFREEGLTKPDDIEEYMQDDIPLNMLPRRRKIMSDSERKELSQMSPNEIDQFLEELERDYS